MRNVSEKFLAHLAIFSCLALGATPAEATPPRGGTGGQPFSLDCGGDSVLAGVNARTGTLVDAVEAVCVKVKADGSWTGGYVSKGRAGGSGGGPISLYCDEGWAVMGIHGRSGALVDKLGVRCGKLGAQGGVVKIVEGNAMRGPSGGNGGSPFDDTCPGGQVGRGLNGRAGTRIDQIELACHNPSVPSQPVTARRGVQAQRLEPALGIVGAGPGKLEVEVPCGAAPVALELRRPGEGVSPARNPIPPLTVDWAEQVEVPLCVTPGWAKYEWASTVGSHFQLKDKDKPRAVLAFSPRAASPGAGFALENGRWTALFGAFVYVDSTSAVEGLTRRAGYVLFPVVVRNMPTIPTITKVWIEDYRPGFRSALENFGVVDPALVGNPERIDGEFYIEGQNLSPSGRRVTLGGREATVLESTTVGSVERLKAKARDFAPGRVVVEGSGVRAQSHALKRLGWWIMDRDVVPSFLQGLSAVVGSPRGQGSVTLLGKTTPFAVQGYRQSGVSIDVVDMRSQTPVFTTRQVGDEMEYQIAIPFETDGRELDGTFLSTVEYWRCGGFQVSKSQCGGTDIGCFLGVIGNSLRSSLSCMNSNNWSTATAPGPSIQLSGDLTSPRATLTVRIGISGGQLSHRGSTLNFSAGIQLSAAGVPLPIEAIHGRIMSEVNTQLTAAVKPDELGRELAGRLQQLVGAMTGRGSELDHLVVNNDGGVFFGFHRP